MNDHDAETWGLQEAAKPSGFTPNAASAAGLAQRLEGRGWLYQLERGPTWEITPKGREELVRRTAS